MKVFFIGTALLLAATVVSAIPLNGGDSEVVVMTTNGPVRGVVSDKSRTFEGIRYAAPITPQSRWSDPVPPTPWSVAPEPWEGTPRGCLQRCHLPPFSCPLTLSEDCLFLTVTTPLGAAPAEGWPVMINLHGGRFEQGWIGSNQGGKDGGVNLYSGDQFVQEAVVLVSLNYRLNIFGFLSSAEFEGNYGFKDQVLGMKWVQDNIRNFGGNPKLVTIFGQSAGASSIAAHLSSPPSLPLFHRAILQSNPWGIRLRETRDAHSYAAKIIKKVGCPREHYMDCMRNQTADALFDAFAAVSEFPEPHPLSLILRWTPTVDGKLILEEPMQMLKHKKIPPVPLMIGNVAEDGFMFIYQLTEKPINVAEFLAANAGVFGVHSARLIKEYPDKNLSDAHAVLSTETTDGLFECPGRYVVDSLLETFSSSSSSAPPLYIYRYDHALSWDAWGPEYPYCVGRVCHGCELPILFGSAPQFFSKEEFDFSRQVTKYWANFAKSADANPNFEGGVNWPRYTEAERGSIKLNVTSITSENVNKEKCDFWDTLGWYQKQ